MGSENSLLKAVDGNFSTWAESLHGHILRWWYIRVAAKPCPDAPMLVGIRISTRTDCCGRWYGINSG